MFRKAFLLFICPVFAEVDYEWAKTIPRSGWTVKSDSFQSENKVAYVLDSNNDTFWQSGGLATSPHYIEINLQQPFVVNGISHLPRQDGTRQEDIGQHSISLSLDGETWADPVAYGTYLRDNTTKFSWFSISTAQFVRLTAGLDGPMSIAELNVYSPDLEADPSAFVPPSSALHGRWDYSLDMPIVPAAGAVSPNGDVVFWAAFRPDRYLIAPNVTGYGLTETATWRPSPSGPQHVSEKSVTDTHHDMFCPGISLDVGGQIVVTGGSDANLTTSYDPKQSKWIRRANMIVPRGYQSTATLGDGRIFTIGGSWSGGFGSKNGEIYDPATNTWTNLTGCEVGPMLTDDKQSLFRNDNHAWLYAWKGNSVLQAGPSRNMNWYNVSGTGSWTPAGQRLDADDAMCGPTAMFDAVNGLILAAGGSPDYQDSNATADAYLIQLGDVNAHPKVTKLPSMSEARAFASTVILPDGKVFVTGGQSYALPFTDSTAAMVPELFDPVSLTWEPMAPITIPRAYHSIAMLLPDATIIAGGAGLCGIGCLQNHFDVEVYSPPYLFDESGNKAARPEIKSVSASSVLPGSTITVEASIKKATFSLVRYGTSTHTINTDQRRVPLSATPMADELTYTITLPSEPGILLPGYWMLFAIDVSGVPSMSLAIHVQIAV